MFHTTTYIQQKKMAGKLWDNKDFEVCKMDPYCSEINEALKDKREEENIRVFRAWEESWEKKKVGPGGDYLLEAKLVKKYAGLKWLDPDSEMSRRVAHPKQMFFDKKRGNNQYHILACMDGYDFSKEPREQEDKYDVWLRNDELFDLVVEFYSNNTDEKVKCYSQYGECDSEEEEE